MQVEVYRFGEFRLDPANRDLSRAGKRIELPGRYFDALALLAAEAGQLVAKDRFFEEVWRGVPVTDEALTQCIKELRKALGDNAARPAFIETVPKYGYRFVAAIEPGGQGKAVALPIGRGLAHTSLQRFLLTGLAGMAGGALAGCVGGLIYGFVAASDSASGGNALSVFVIMWLLTLRVGRLGCLGMMPLSSSSAQRLTGSPALLKGCCLALRLHWRRARRGISACAAACCWRC